MTKLHLPAVKVTQGGLTLYSTAIKVKDLVREGFYSVETLDPSNPNDSGLITNHPLPWHIHH